MGSAIDRLHDRVVEIRQLVNRFDHFCSRLHSSGRVALLGYNFLSGHVETFMRHFEEAVGSVAGIGAAIPFDGHLSKSGLSSPVTVGDNRYAGLDAIATKLHDGVNTRTTLDFGGVIPGGLSTEH